MISKRHLINAIDVGGYNTKAIVGDGENFLDVPDASGNFEFVTAVYKDPATGELLYSHDAMNAGIADPKNLAFDVKRHLPDDTKRYFGGTASSKDVMVMIFKHLFDQIAQKAGQTVPDCALTHPFVWPDQATRNLIEAAEKAGFKVIPSGPGGGGILTEPTAAALAYADLNNLGNADVIVIIVDIGSTTTDVTVVRFRHGVGEVLGGHGDPNLGGFNFLADFTELVLAQAKKDGILKAADIAKLQDRKDDSFYAFQRVCEDTLKALSTRPEARVPIMITNKPSVVKISRDRVETEILAGYAKRICAVADQAIANAVATGKLPATKKPDYLVGVGGPCRNSYFREQISTHLGVPMRSDIDPMRGIVTGAGKHAAWLMAQRNPGEGRVPKNIIRPREVVPHDIGIMLQDSREAPLYSMVIVPKGESASCTKTVHLKFLDDHQTSFRCYFVQCQGNGRPVEECHLLGELFMDGLPTEAVRTSRLEITATFDEAAMVRMHVRDLVSGRTDEVRFSGRVDGSQLKSA